MSTAIIIPNYIMCAGLTDANTRCGAPALSGNTLCRHHQYQHRYAEWERPEIAATMARERKARQRRSLDELVRQKENNRLALLLTRRCHSCHVYRATEWNDERGYWHCRYHLGS